MSLLRSPQKGAVDLDRRLYRSPDAPVRIVAYGDFECPYFRRAAPVLKQLVDGSGGCSGITCWRRLRDWTQAGVWPALHELLLAELRATDRLDLDRCAGDGSHVRALKGGTTSAPRRSTAAVPVPSTI
jgi:hypothetical protein